jgi:hypothetical protein
VHQKLHREYGLSRSRATRQYRGATPRQSPTGNFIESDDACGSLDEPIGPDARRFQTILLSSEKKAVPATGEYLLKTL